MSRKEGFTLLELAIVIAISIFVSILLTKFLHGAVTLTGFITTGLLYLIPPFTTLLIFLKYNQKKRIITKRGSLIIIKSIDYSEVQTDFNVLIYFCVFLWPIALTITVTLLSIKWLLNKIKGDKDFIPKE